MLQPGVYATKGNRPAARGRRSPLAMLRTKLAPFATLAPVAATLYTLHQSPWSERARWALLHHQVDFVERAHVPITGELALRLRAKKWRRVSVPLLVDDDGTPVVGSLEIAEHVDRKGKGATLFPADLRGRIQSLHETLEATMNAARARLMGRLRADPEALNASLPSYLQGTPFASAVGRAAVSFIVRKYDVRDDDVDARMRAGLLSVREVLGSKPFVLGDFTFADVLATSVVQTIEPVDDRYLRLAPATRRSWMHDTLRHEFADLVAWRDGVYRAHR